MRLATYTLAGVTRLGAVAGEHVVDLPVAYAEFQLSQGNAEPGAVAFPTDLLSLLTSDDDVKRAAREAIAWAESIAQEKRAEPFVRPASAVQFRPPIPRPSKIICVGLNYADHCREQNVPEPERPVLFVKFPSAMIGHEDAITWPEGASEQVDYEAELAVVIGRVAKNVPAAQAMDYVGGYTVIDDVSARDVQFADGQWVRGKSFDTFCPVGPVLVTPDEVGDPHALGIRSRVNGEVRQDSNTTEMIFKIPYLIEYISRTCTLLPGDIISTGTPDGVGVFMKPPVFLKPGDVVEVEIDGIGCLRNPVR